MKTQNIKFPLTFFAIILMNIIVVNGQELPVDKETGKVIFTEIVELSDNSVPKDILYNRAKEWFVKAFKSSNDVIQLDDKESGKIIGKGNFSISKSMWLTDSQVDFTITIMVKDGRYKYIVSDFFHVSTYNEKMYSGGSLDDEKPDCGTFNMAKKGWKQVKEQTKSTVDNLIADLKTFMENGSVGNDDNW